MKLTSLQACYIACLLNTAPVFAQIAVHSGTNPIQPFAFYHNSDPGLNHFNFFEKNASAMQVAPADMVLETQNTDEQGFTHFKYQQYYQGLPVFGCHYILHEKGGVVRSANGRFQPGAKASAQASFSADASKSFAIRALKSTKYDREKTKATLCFFNPSDVQAPQSLRLVYMVDFHSIEPFDKRRYFIDAHTGKILDEYPLLLQESVPSKAKTFYYGAQDIISDSLGPHKFTLRDLTRGDGIFVYDLNTNGLFKNNSSFWELGPPDIAAIGLDAHFCAEKYYDMMLDDYHWNGINGQGGALMATVHDGAYANAFWDGERSIYGDGNCDYGPLTTLEIVGHEFTHGMVQYTSKLVYNSESGAINESLADIFGKLLERKNDPDHFSWEVGHTFITNPGALPFRVMNNPHNLGMPAYYKGQLWHDNYDVHTNSAIGNLWFSMLIDGKQGTNEIGYSFNVSAIDPVKIGTIIFETNKNYLTEDATYNDFCNYSIEAAGNLYGQGSPEQLAVTEAWKAVGLPTNKQADYFDLKTSIEGQFVATSICASNTFTPITVTISNLGALAYDPVAQTSVKLSCTSLPDKDFTLNDPIAPGESVDYVIDGWFKPLSGQMEMSCTMNLADDDLNNNTFFKTFLVVKNPFNDFLLGAYPFPPACFDTTQLIYFYLYNHSCEPIPAGTAIKITATNSAGNTLWTGPAEFLSSAIANDDVTVLQYNVPVFDETVLFNLDYSPDPDLTNNWYSYDPFSTKLPITGNYLNTFELNFGVDEYLRLNAISDIATLLYQNNHFFAATGIDAGPETFPHCTDPLAVFSDPNNPGRKASIKACVDFSTAATSTLDFDAALFRNPSTNLYSSMLQVKWEGNESGNRFIYDQPEGQVWHTQLNLPPYFKGELSFNLYTEQGKEYINPNFLGSDDFVLLDNLMLKTATSASQESSENQGVLIAPNPAAQTVRIQTKVPMKSIRLFNAAGQLIQSLSVRSYSRDLELSELSRGLYWVGIQLENGNESVQKLVKMD